MSFSQVFDILGGSSFGSGNDYGFYASAFTTGKSCQEVYDSFVMFYAKKITSYVSGTSGLGGLIISNPMIDLSTNT